jgi:hypothetical protein
MTKKTLNPYKAGTGAHAAWDAGYQNQPNTGISAPMLRRAANEGKRARGEDDLAAKRAQQQK